MKFAHIADCHIGGWSDPKMKELSLKAFDKAMKYCVEHSMDFVLIAGDLFNTALPQIDLIKETVGIMKRVKDAGIKIYVIPGSHDFSPSGKTMLDVLEKAGLCENVVKIEDNKLLFTQVGDIKITGMLGKKGGLEKEDYKELDFSNIENESGFKIFMFHTAIDELKPQGMEMMESMKEAELPKNFDYYAGGHVHSILEKDYSTGKLVFPGALFPNNFKEMEEFKQGGFYVVNYDGNLTKEYVPVKLKDVITIDYSVDNKTSSEVNDELIEKCSILDSNDKIILIRLKGTLKQGKPSDLDFKEIFSKMDDAYFIMKNSNKVLSIQFEQNDEIKDVKNVEPELIEMHAYNTKLFNDSKIEKRLITDLIQLLDKERTEGEKSADFEIRISTEALKSLGL
ncbi:MAG: exonuclease SbcCD subunit D [Nanoarchaeota archaeon]|nr:exonuclease SbcCD subunit D [Nanoarchaeota archaeon]